MASKRQIDVGGVKIGGGAPVAVQSMTKTETADYDATMRQIHAIADAGGDLVRCAVPRDEDVQALKRIVVESPIPVIADIHFNHTLALKAIDAGRALRPHQPGQHRRPREDRRGRREGPRRRDPDAHRGQLRLAAQAPARAGAREPGRGAGGGRGRARRADGAGSTSRTSRSRSSRPTCRTRSRRTACCRSGSTTRCTSGITEAGTKWSGSLKSAVGLGTLLADGVGDTIRISLSTFHAEEEVKVAWEILKALKLRERGPVLIACPTCGRLQFDMDTVVADIEERLRAYDDPIEVAVLGCAVNGIGEASHADFGITGAKNEGLIFAHGKPLRKVPQDQLVDELFAEIDKSLDVGRVVVDERKAAEGAEWLEQIEEENAGELTPERLAAMEAVAGAPRSSPTAPRCRWHGRQGERSSWTRRPARRRAAASRGPRGHGRQRSRSPSVGTVDRLLLRGHAPLPRPRLARRGGARVQGPASARFPLLDSQRSLRAPRAPAWKPPSAAPARATRSSWSRGPSPASGFAWTRALARPERGRTLERFVFRLALPGARGDADPAGGLRDRGVHRRWHGPSGARPRRSGTSTGSSARWRRACWRRRRARSTRSARQRASGAAPAARRTPRRLPSRARARARRRPPRAGRTASRRSGAARPAASGWPMRWR